MSKEYDTIIMDGKEYRVPAADEINSKTFIKRYREIYNRLYDNNIETSFYVSLCEYKNKTDEQLHNTIVEISRRLGDIICSDRELSAFLLTYCEIMENVQHTILGQRIKIVD